jgi:hypothetical protein
MDNIDETIERLRAQLPDLDVQLALWHSKVQQEFDALIDAINKRGIRAEDLDNDPEVARLAEANAGPSPQGELYGLLDELCPIYIQATPEQRDDIRRLVRHNREVLLELLGYVGRNINRLAEAGDPRWLELALTAVSIQDLRDDFRDTYIGFRDLYLTAIRFGIDPMPYFEAAAEISTTDNQYGMGSTRDFLAEFEQSAYFAEAVKPKLDGH